MATIWTSWSDVTRFAVTTRLDASDIAALRFGVADLLLSRGILRRGVALDRLGQLGPMPTVIKNDRLCESLFGVPTSLPPRGNPARDTNR
jgi:hypothetical protein